MTQMQTWSDIQGICRSHAGFRDALDWLCPIFDCSDEWPSVAQLNAVAETLVPGFGWEFVAQAKVPRRAKSRGDASLSGYVDMIASHGKIPIREKNLHDLFNCLSFLMFPKSKHELNRRHQSESPQGLKPGQNRTRVQDLLTIFDEGGVIRLKNADGKHKDIIFGHAVYEHIVCGKTIRAARFDQLIDGDLSNQTSKKLIAEADSAFAIWLQNQNHCQSPDEFSSVWI